MRRRQRRVVVRFSGNGPLTFLRQLDVVADAAIAARTCDVKPLFRNPRAHCPFRAMKPQVEVLTLCHVLGMFDICRILPAFASAASLVLLDPR